MSNPAYIQEEVPNVPTFNFSLHQLDTSFSPRPTNLFDMTPQRNKFQSNRKPGMITNLRNLRIGTVTQLLHVFKPKQQQLFDQFNIKKKLVANAIDAIYQNKNYSQYLQANNYGTKKKQKLQKNDVKQFQRSNSEYLNTPAQKDKINYNQSDSKTRISYSTAQKTRRHQSQSKLNYSRFEEKFNQSQIYKLRKKSGFKMFK